MGERTVWLAGGEILRAMFGQPRKYEGKTRLPRWLPVFDGLPDDAEFVDMRLGPLGLGVTFKHASFAEGEPADIGAVDWVLVGDWPRDVPGVRRQRDALAEQARRQFEARPDAVVQNQA